MIMELLSRFWEKVERHGPDECWLWKGASTANGYGQMAIGEGGRKALATHIALAIDGRFRHHQQMLALHSCDNPICVNPRHLRWGTSKENTADCMGRGRMRLADRSNAPRGSYNRKAKLNAAKVRYIRSSNQTTTQLAAELGVTSGCISSVRRGKTWGHLK